jgi:hypothetical protein
MQMCRILFLLTLLSSLATAETKGSRTCRILFLGAPDDAPKELLLFDGKTSQEVELPRMNLSPVYQLPAGPLVLRMLTSPVTKPEEIDPQSPKATVPEAVNDLYLLVSSDPSNKVAPVRLQVIDANPGKFHTGQMLWFNLTKNRVGGQIGSQKLAMEPNSRIILDAPASANEDYQVNVTYRIPGNEQLYPLCETKWSHNPDARTIFFIIGQEGSRTPRILGFPDSREPTDAKESP